MLYLLTQELSYSEWGVVGVLSFVIITLTKFITEKITNNQNSEVKLTKILTQLKELDTKVSLVHDVIVGLSTQVDILTRYAPTDDIEMLPLKEKEKELFIKLARIVSVFTNKENK